MPEEEYVWLPRDSILSFEEVERLARVFGSLGVTKLRLTGGEPLLRHDLSDLVSLLAQLGTVEDIALTTNGLLLPRYVDALKAAGLGRITVSLDTLREDRFAQLSRTKRHAEVLAGIALLRRAGFRDTKLNCVVMRGFNDDELGDMIEFGRVHEAQVRFIEYMDVGGATRWSMDRVVPRIQILERIAARYGDVTPLQPDAVTGGRAPADRFALPDGTTFGIIASTTQPFCRGCDRSRLTADGLWFLCLYSQAGVDLKEPLRSGATDDEVAGVIRSTWSDRTDRGAELRTALAGRGALYQIDRLRADPHREMHTRGG
jgi:cyclic pyranopterin phosphate synthase